MGEKIGIAIVGYGNIGHGVFEAIKRNPDMSLTGIITRRPLAVKSEFVDSSQSVFSDLSFSELVPSTNVAVLCGGSKNDLPKQTPLFVRYFNTVDSFDTHANISEYFEKIDRIAKQNKKVAIISAGWDPGTFSLERVLADSFLPGARRYTFWGRGVSQGHSDAARQINGVRDARQYTIPRQEAIERVRRGDKPELTTREKHRRLVYVVAEERADLRKIEEEIKTMPNYFADYDTEVIFISEKEMRRDHSSYPHAGFVLTSGETGKGNKAIIEYRNEWQSNPEATASILVACARACHRLNEEGKAGAFTMLDIPPAYFSPRSREAMLKEFM